MNNSNVKYDDDIDLVRILTSIWRAKIFIILSVIIVILCAIFYLRIVDSKYTISYKLMPVSKEQNTPNLSGLGGIASLTGIEIPTGSSGEFNVYKELLYSDEVAQKIMRNEKLVQKIFYKEWNKFDKKYSEIEKSSLGDLRSWLKKVLIGGSQLEYIPPNSKRLARFVFKNIDMSEDKKTGFLTLEAQHSNPKMIISLIIEITNASDEIMRDRYIKFSKEPLNYYKEKLNASRAREHREALARLISREEQKLMLASSSKYFTAEPIKNPEVSIYPTSPKPLMTLVLASLFGLIISIMLALIRTAFLRGNS